jgi:hypothetical protein
MTSPEDFITEFFMDETGSPGLVTTSPQSF